VEACPFEAVFLDPRAEKAMVCDLCGGAPQCVKWCPTAALSFPLSAAEGGKGEPKTPEEAMNDLARLWGIPSEELERCQGKD
jgi:Fe-S-cluster-containing hydrogenase component 2